MRKWFLLIFAVLPGCAGMRMYDPPAPTLTSLWRHVSPGQSSKKAMEIMGAPDEFGKEGAGYTMTWHMDRFEKCTAVFSQDEKVIGKRCEDDAAARAAMMQVMIESGPPPMLQAPSFQMPPPPTQTNCTSRRGINGTIRTDCNSY